MAQYCRSCGGEVAETARFCSVCGAATGYGVPAAAPGAGPSRLVRLRAGRQIAGVCQAFANAYGWDVVLVRVLMLVAAIVTIPFAEIVYLVCWLVIPEEPLAVPASTGASYAPPAPH